MSLDAADVGAAAADHTHPSSQSEQWRFQDNPTIADPGDGYLRSNTGVLATATVLAISRTTQDGYDIPPTGFGVAGGDTVYVQDRDDNTQVGALHRRRAPGPLRHLRHGRRHRHWTRRGPSPTGRSCRSPSASPGAGAAGGTDYLTEGEADGLYLPLAHAALPDVHHAQGHNHTAADSSGVLTNDEHDGYSQYTNLGADPGTPATNRIRLYAKDNGSGVATLYYISESGQIYELPTLTTGGGGSGAPSNASYVTLAAETKLSAETALGAGVVMSGLLSARPAFGTAGRLYLATDTDLVYRDSGSAWATFAARTAAAGGGLPLTGGTLSGALTGTALTLSGTVTLGSTAQPKITVASGAPGSPATGDLWIW